LLAALRASIPARAADALESELHRKFAVKLTHRAQTIREMMHAMQISLAVDDDWE
jgi:hypothetical protein